MNRWKAISICVLGLLTGLLVADGAAADDTGARLLRASEGLQMPGSEADSAWWFVSYPDQTGLPDVGQMARLTGCPDGGVSRRYFDATLDDLGDVRPWMDRGQKQSARGFMRLQKVFHRHYDDLAVYRCEAGTAEVPIYFVGMNDAGLSGLLTVNIET